MKVRREKGGREGRRERERRKNRGREGKGEGGERGEREGGENFFGINFLKLQEHTSFFVPFFLP